MNILVKLTLNILTEWFFSCKQYAYPGEISQPLPI